MTCLIVSGCLWHGEGLVHSGDRGPTLEGPTGQRYKLVLGEESQGLAYLDGYVVTLDGRRVGRRLKAGEWHILDGMHGMTVWFGRLERRGAQLGLHDRNNGGFYLVARSAEESLAPQLGKQVLIEGYVVGTHLIEVTDWKVLE